MKRFATITVIGQDKTGVVAQVTNFLFDLKANIEALEEQVTRGQFSMTLQASWSPAHFNVSRLQTGLKKLARQLSMEITARLTDPKRRQRFAIMVTKEPHCLEGLLQAVQKRRLNAEPCLVMGNRVDLKPLADQHKIPFHYVPWNQRDRAENRALKILQKAEVDFVVLARFMKILSPNFVWRFKNKVINIHPSLLPSFPGPQAYRQAYESGVKIVGVTAHFVTMHLDEGPVISQNAFPIKSGMSLKEIVQKGQILEAKTLTKAVQLYLNRKLDVYWGKVKEV